MASNKYEIIIHTRIHKKRTVHMTKIKDNQVYSGEEEWEALSDKARTWQAIYVTKKTYRNPQETNRAYEYNKEQSKVLRRRTKRRTGREDKLGGGQYTYK